MKDIFEKLFAHRPLAYAEAKECFGKITDNLLYPSQVGAFISVYRMRSITPEELKGFRDALLERAKLVSLGEVMDVCGTGGDGKNSFNISTLTAFVVAACGVRVAKHGNYGVSSVCGSSHILESIGIQFRTSESELRRDLDTMGITFIHAPLFHPVLKNVAPLRKELGFRTFFNILGPLVNPSRPQSQMSGVLNMETARLYEAVVKSESSKYSVISSLDGFDEISLTASWKVLSNFGEAEYSPEVLGLSRILMSEISGGDSIDDGVKIFRDILAGQGTQAQKAVVCCNSAFALMTYFSTEDFSHCFAQAQEALSSGKAKSLVEKMVELNPKR